MNKAQGSLEYLLLIGGAVLIAVIVIMLLLSTSESTSSDVKATAGVLSRYHQGVQTCEGQQFEIERVMITNNSVSVENITIDETKIIRKIELQVSPTTHFDQSYSVHINGTNLGTLADSISNTEPLLFDGLSQPVNPTQFTFEITSSGSLQAKFKAILILCDE